MQGEEKGDSEMGLMRILSKSDYVPDEGSRISLNERPVRRSDEKNPRYLVS
jgi:hypothetical protein